VSSVLVESDEFPVLTVVLFSSEAEPASSTTASWIYYDRLALLEAGYALSDLVHTPCGFVAERYRILDCFELPSGNVKIAMTDSRSNNLYTNLPGPCLRPISINYGKRPPRTCEPRNFHLISVYLSPIDPLESISFLGNVARAGETRVSE